MGDLETLIAETQKTLGAIIQKVCAPRAPPCAGTRARSRATAEWQASGGRRRGSSDSRLGAPRECHGRAA